jgi:hypothetical protein
MTMQTLHIPLQLDSRRRLAVSSDGADVMRAQIIDMMVTARGERVFRPSYGAGVPEMLFGNIDPMIFKIKEKDIKNFLSSRMVAGVIEAVALSQKDGEESTLIVTVSFSLLPGGEVFTVSQTFTGLVTEESF